MSTFDDAMAVAAAAMDAPAETPAPAPSTPTEAPAETAPAGEEPQPDVPAPRVPPETLQKLRERNKAKREREEFEREKRELQQMRAEVGKGREAPTGIDPKRLLSDPLRALEAAGVDATVILNALTKHMVTPDAASLEAKIEARLAEKDAKIEALQKRLEDRENTEHTARASEAHERAKASFVTHTSDKAKYPNAAKLSAERRAARGTRKAQELIDSGITDFDIDDVARLVEEDLHSELSELLGRDPNEPAPASAEPTPSQPATTGRTAPAKRPNTITSDAASSTAAPPRAMTEKERVAAAIAVANRK